MTTIPIPLARLHLLKLAARCSVGFVWVYEGLVPKLLHPSTTQLEMIRRSGWWWGSPELTIQWLGIAMIGAGLVIMSGWFEKLAQLVATAFGAGADGPGHPQPPARALRPIRRPRQGRVPVHLLGRRLAAQHSGSLLSFVVFETFRADEPALRGADQPFPAVRIVARLAERVVGHDVENQILGAVIDELMGLAGLEDECIARLDSRRPILVPDLFRCRRSRDRIPTARCASDRDTGLPRRNAADLDVKRMPLEEIGRERLASERLGDLLAGAREFPFW